MKLNSIIATALCLSPASLGLAQEMPTQSFCGGCQCFSEQLIGKLPSHDHGDGKYCKLEN
jgi:hypothetical protein